MKKGYLLATALFLTAAGFAQNTKNINLTKGQKFVVKSDIKTHTVTEAMGQEIENDTKITGVYNITVDDATANDYKLTGTLAGMKIHTSMMGQEMEYDSDTPDASNPMAAGMDEVLNKPQTITINKQGKVVTKSSSGEDLSPVLQQIEASGAGSKAAFMAVPSNLKAGDTFEVNDIDTAMGTKSNVKYTVKSISGDMATLTFKGTISSDMTMENQGMEVHTKTEGPIEGESVVNIKTGVIKTANSKATAEGTVSVMGQDMPVKVEAITNVTVTGGE